MSVFSSNNSDVGKQISDSFLLETPVQFWCRFPQAESNRLIHVWWLVLYFHIITLFTKSKTYSKGWV